VLSEAINSTKEKIEETEKERSLGEGHSTFQHMKRPRSRVLGDPGNVGLVAERVRKSKRPLEMIALLHKSPLHAGCDQLPLSRISQVEWKHSRRSITPINSDACASMHRHVGLQIGPDCIFHVQFPVSGDIAMDKGGD